MVARHYRYFRIVQAEFLLVTLANIHWRPMIQYTCHDVRCYATFFEEANVSESCVKGPSRFTDFQDEFPAIEFLAIASFLMSCFII